MVNADAAIYLSLFPIYNYYAFILAVFFLPSNKVEDDPTDDIINRGIRADNDFEKELEKLDLDDDFIVPADEVGNDIIIQSNEKPTNESFSLD
jgi:hypothetical protein